jgi:diamine N-acetyltransferase
VLSQGKYRLRAMEPEDAPLLHQWENRSEEWWLGAQLAPISLEAMERFAGGDHDVWADRQIRLILDLEGQPIGAFDLYDVDPRSRKAGVGVVIGQAFRKNGHATIGLQLLTHYAFEHLGLRMIFAEVPAVQPASKHLFSKAGFESNGILKQWVRRGIAFEDLLLMQLFNPAMSDEA